MKYKMIIFVLSMFGLFIMAFAANQKNANVPVQDKMAKDADRTVMMEDMNYSGRVAPGEFNGGIIWTETFEKTATWGNWTGKDNTYPRPEPGPSEWIIDGWNAYDGTSWRCADSTLGNYGGYDNHWYQVLDTPPMLLDEDATFTFFHRYAVEDPAGVPAPYDGWDGMNVRISTDGGETWTVLPSATYNVSSSWAFGHPDQGQNEGPGIPSWAGRRDDWHQESFDLSAYTGNEVMLRFAFASDMGYSTGDGAPDLYGWQIDNIEVKSANKVFFTNYGTDVDMAGKSNEFIPPPGGDLWHIVRIDDPIPPFLPEMKPFGFAKNFAAVCQRGQYIYSPDSTYNPYMDNIFFTGPISLPVASPIYLDYKYVPNFYDYDDFPNVEFFRPEVSLDGETWEFIEEQPYVYSFGYFEWLEFSWVYGYPLNMSMFDLSRFAGQDIYLSFRFWSDYDQPLGPGLLIDDIVIYSPTAPIPAPQNLTADVDPDAGGIMLNWDDMHKQVIFQIWRKAQSASNFTLIDQVIGENSYLDTSIDPYFEYSYVVTAVVKYTGNSEPSNVATAEYIPPGVIMVSYDDSEPDSAIAADRNKLIGVKFTPQSYPVSFEALKIYLDKTGTSGTAAQFAIYDDNGTGGTPGTRMAYKNKSGLVAGFNTIIFSSTVTIDEGSFWVTYKRYGNGLKVGVDKDAPIDGHTYVQTGSGWVQQTDCDALFHVYLDTTRSRNIDVVAGIGTTEVVNPERLALFRNYPNPFNPSTSISFNVPAQLSNQPVTLEIYNVLGKKVISLFNGTAQSGLNTVRWDGRNQSGILVPSGLYISRLTCGDKQLMNRMLLIK